MSHRIIIGSRIAISANGKFRLLEESEHVSDPGEIVIDLHASYLPPHDQDHQITVGYVDHMLMMLKKMEHVAEKNVPRRSETQE